MTWGNGEPNGSVLGAPLENCSKSAFVYGATFLVRQIGVCLRGDFYAVAKRRSCGCRATFMLRQIGVCFNGP